MEYRNIAIAAILSCIVLGTAPANIAVAVSPAVNPSAHPKKYAKDDIAVIKPHEKEIISQHIAHLLGPWPAVVEGLKRHRLRNPFREYEEICESPEFQKYLQQNRILIEHLYKKLYGNDKYDKQKEKILDKEALKEKLLDPDWDCLLEHKFSSLLFYHPAFIQAHEEEKLNYDYGDYMGQQGCDLINASLRGDLSINWSWYYGLNSEPKKDKAPATWGTYLGTNMDGALYRMESALRLKQDLSHLELEEMTLYRGICLPKVLNSVATDNRPIIEEAAARIISGGSYIEDFSGKNIVYRAKDISSTSKSEEKAAEYAHRVWRNSGVTPVLLEITIKKGTAFGKDTGRTDTQEIMLKPGQKMRINSAEKCIFSGTEGILFKCETIAD